MWLGFGTLLLLACVFLSFGLVNLKMSTNSGTLECFCWAFIGGKKGDFMASSGAHTSWVKVESVRFLGNFCMLGKRD